MSNELKGNIERDENALQAPPIENQLTTENIFSMIESVKKEAIAAGEALQATPFWAPPAVQDPPWYAWQGKQLEKFYLVQQFLDRFRNGPTKLLILAAEQLLQDGVINKEAFWEENESDAEPYELRTAYFIRVGHVKEYILKAFYHLDGDKGAQPVDIKLFWKDFMRNQENLENVPWQE